MTCAPEPDNRITPRGADGGAEEAAAAALARFAADARIDERVAQRRRDRWLQRQAGESTSLAGLLRNLAEASVTVQVTTSCGDRHRGVLTALGSDALVLATAGDRLVVVALRGLVAVDVGGERARTGDRTVASDGPSLRHLLSELAGTDTTVCCVADGAERTEGRLLWVGDDVLAIALGGPGGDVRTTAPLHRYLRLSSLIEVSAAASG